MSGSSPRERYIRIPLLASMVFAVAPLCPHDAPYRHCRCLRRQALAISLVLSVPLLFAVQAIMLGLLAVLGAFNDVLPQQDLCRLLVAKPVILDFQHGLAYFKSRCERQHAQRRQTHQQSTTPAEILHLERFQTVSNEDRRARGTIENTNFLLPIFQDVQA
jgi:hypothetical protein